jgi:CelD/BcsL family acetyltransferase involved in cellulose biosynthesis
MTMRLLVAATREELHRLREPWERVWREAGEPSPFLGFDWVATWWDHFGEGRELLALVAEDGDGVVGVAPLTISRYRFRGLPLRVLEFVSAPFRGPCHGGCLDFLVLRRGRECLAAFAEAMLSEAARWDMMSLRNVPVESEHLVQLGRAAGSGLSLRCTRVDAIASIRAASWTEFLRSRRRHFRQWLRNSAKAAERAGLGSTTQLTDAEQVRAILPELARVRAASWKASEQAGSAQPADPTAAFLASLLPRLCAQGRAAVSTLSRQDRLVAYWLAFRGLDLLWIYDTAYDQTAAEGSPGVNTLVAAIRGALESGLSLVDLGPGDQAYKRRWATGYLYRGHWLGFHRGWRSRALSLAGRLAGARRPAPQEVEG